MKKLILFILSFVLNHVLIGQSAPLIPSTKITISSVTVFTDPYTVVGTTNDITSNWTASDITVGDSVYLEDGSELRVYYVQSIISAVSTNFTIQINDINNTGNVPPTGQGALYRGTANYDLPNFTGGISESLQTMIQNRFVQRLDAILLGQNGSFICTDSFTTFTGYNNQTLTFAQIPIGALVTRTTTGNIWQKTSSTTMTRRTLENGLNASTILNVSNDTLSFNANLNNHIRLSLNPNTDTDCKINAPTNIATQFLGETFLIGVTSGTVPLTITWDTIYGRLNMQNGIFEDLSTTMVPAQSTVNYAFRVVTNSAEGIMLQMVDDYGGASTQSYTVTQTAHGYVSGDVGKLAYLTSGNLIKLAKADTLTADSVAQWVISKIVDANTVELCNNCYVTKTAHGIALNSYVFTSGTTLGGISNSKTTNRNNQLVGKVTGVNQIYYQIHDLSPSSGGGGGGSADGVVTGGTFNGTNLVLNRSVGADVTISGTVLNTSTDATLAAQTAAFVNCTGGMVTLTLPAPASNSNKSYEVLKIDASANPIKLSGAFATGTERLVNDNNGVIVRSNGISWYLSKI
jgi:hypothetical protein